MVNEQTIQPEEFPSKQDQILLYGPGKIGKLMLFNLRENGYHVCGFMGRNAKQHPVVEGLPCWLPEEVPAEHRAEYLVIVSLCTRDPGDYVAVAKNLRELGFSRVMYYEKLYLLLSRDSCNWKRGGNL